VRLPNTWAAIAGASGKGKGKRPGTMGSPQPDAEKKSITSLSDSDDEGHHDVELYGFSFSHFLTSSDMGQWRLVI